MKLNRSKLGTRIGAIALLFALFLVSVFPAQATNVDNLEDKTSGLESELSDLNKELNALGNELDDILTQIDEISDNLETTKEELAIAKGEEEAQYESMKLRIKYMYENGNFSFLEMLLSSTCMAEFLNKAEYFSAISKQDREMLGELTQTREEIAKKEKQLEADQAYLISLQDELDEKEKALNDKISDTSSELSKYTAKLERAREEARKAEEEAKQQVTPVKPNKGNSGSSGSSSTTTTIGSAVSASASDIELLAALLECEAGSRNYEAVLAVASVVVNRMKSRYYPDTVRGVIYQSGQFPPAHDGKVDRVLKRGVKDLCVQAATDALNGKNNVGDCLSFRASSSGRDGIVIGDNVFF